LKSVSYGGYIHAVGFVAQGVRLSGGFTKKMLIKCLLLEQDATEMLDLPVTLVSKAVTLRGVLIGSRTLFEELTRVLAFKIRPFMDKVFHFDQANDAFMYLGKQSHVGSVVIQVSKTQA